MLRPRMTVGARISGSSDGRCAAPLNRSEDADAAGVSSPFTKNTNDRPSRLLHPTTFRAQAMTFDYMSMIATLILMSDIYSAETSRCANMTVRGRFIVTERQTAQWAIHPGYMMSEDQLHVRGAPTLHCRDCELVISRSLSQSCCRLGH